MSDAAEKPFEPTHQRVARAKREGNVARSSEFAANLSFAAAVLTAIATAPLFGGVARSLLVLTATPAARPQCALVIAASLLPLGSAAAAAVAAALFQNGGLATTAVAPKLARLDPGAGLKRMFSRETLAHSARAALAFGCAAAAMAPVLGACAGAMLATPAPVAVAAAAWKGAQGVAFAAVAVGLSFSVAEYAAARRAWLRTLRMSFEERKRETRDEEGDAQARGRRRALHRAVLRGGMGRVKDAAFVVANPTHVVVALEYRPPDVPVPRILVRATDDVASHVRRVARECGIPIVEDAPLARALYRDGRAGEPIPHAHYVAVAEVVAALLPALQGAR